MKVEVFEMFDSSGQPRTLPLSEAEQAEWEEASVRAEALIRSIDRRSRRGRRR